MLDEFIDRQPGQIGGFDTSCDGRQVNARIRDPGLVEFRRAADHHQTSSVRLEADCHLERLPDIEFGERAHNVVRQVQASGRLGTETGEDNFRLGGDPVTILTDESGRLLPECNHDIGLVFDVFLGKIAGHPIDVNVVGKSG